MTIEQLFPHFFMFLNNFFQPLSDVEMSVSFFESFPILVVFGIFAVILSKHNAIIVMLVIIVAIMVIPYDDNPLDSIDRIIGLLVEISLIVLFSSKAQANRAFFNMGLIIIIAIVSLQNIQLSPDIMFQSMIMNTAIGTTTIFMLKFRKSPIFFILLMFIMAFIILLDPQSAGKNLAEFTANIVT